MAHFKIAPVLPNPVKPKEEVELDLIPELRAKQYLRQILTSKRGEPVKITVPWGKSTRVIARVRTELSRLRSELKRQKLDIRLFKLLVIDIKQSSSKEDGDIITFLVDDAANAVKHELSDLASLILDDPATGRK